MRPSPGQHGVEPLAFPEFVYCSERAQPAVRAQVQSQVRTPNRPQRKAAQGGASFGASMRLDLHPQSNHALKRNRGTNEFGTIGGNAVADLGAGAKRQRIGDLDDARPAAQLGDEHGGVGLVPLPSLHDVLGGDREMTPSRAIQEAAEERF